MKTEKEVMKDILDKMSFEEKKEILDFLLKNKSEGNTRGLYQLFYGYAGHQTLFVSTRKLIEEGKGHEICMETSKHEQEDVNIDDIELVTEDQDFIDLFLKYNLSGINPLDYI